MNKTNYGSKYEIRMIFRVTPLQFDYIMTRCKHLDMTPSEFLRSVLDLQLVQYIARGGKIENKQNDSND